MKTKFLTLVILTISFLSTTSAQDLTYGVRVGMNIANVSCSEGNDGSKALAGLTFGGTAHYLLNDKASLSAELLFSMQGYKYNFNDYDESSNSDDYDGEIVSKYKLNYVNVPVLYNYLITDKLSVKFGVQIGFLLSASNREVWTEDDLKCIEIEYGKEYCNDIDFAIPLGLSYDVTDNIYIDARYNFGISNFAKDSGDYKFYNNVFALSVGYKF